MNIHLRYVTAAAESALRIIILNRYFCSSFCSLFRISQISSILYSVPVREAIFFLSRNFAIIFHKKLSQRKMHFLVIIPSVVQLRPLFAQMVRSNVFLFTFRLHAFSLAANWPRKLLFGVFVLFLPEPNHQCTEQILFVPKKSNKFTLHIFHSVERKKNYNKKSDESKRGSQWQ